MSRPFGQHFLKHVPKEVLPDWNRDSQHRILEIGPGKGSVTFSMLKGFQKAHESNPNTKLHLTLIEVDNALASDLQPRLASFQSESLYIQLQNLSILDFNLQEYFLSAPANSTQWVISSLPYNISKQIIKKLAEDFASSKTLLPNVQCRFIIQREVGESYASQPPQATFLGNWLQLYADEIRAHVVIKPREFSPPPKVESIVLSYSLTKPALTLQQRKSLISLLRRGFTNPRKTINKAVQTGMSVTHNESLHAILRRRPGELSLNDWLAVWKAVDTVAENDTIYTNYLKN